jgi:tRNA A-37 threonylcarbamoyl transferase component Bud32
MQGLLDGIPAAIKVYDVSHSPTRESFHKEVSFYNCLKKLQGIAIPKVSKTGYLSSTGSAVLVLQLGIKVSFEPRCQKKTRTSAEAALMMLHKEGVTHGDIRREHLVMCGDNVWLISLQNCRLEIDRDVRKYELQQLKECF